MVLECFIGYNILCYLGVRILSLGPGLPCCCRDVLAGMLASFGLWIYMCCLPNYMFLL